MKLLRCLGLAQPRDDWRDKKEAAMRKARSYHMKGEPRLERDGYYCTGSYPTNF